MEDFFKIACEEAEHGLLAGEGGPFGAVIVKNGIVLGRGHNQVLADHDSTAHAEIGAIRQAEQALGTHELSGCELYTTCFPCPMCLGAILWARIAAVHYGSTSDDAAAAGFDDRAFYSAFTHLDSNPFVKLEYNDFPACRSLFAKWKDLPHHRMY